MTQELALYVLDWLGRQRDHRMDTVATAVFLSATEHAVQIAWFKGRQEGRFRIDSALVANLYETAPVRIKIALVLTLCLGYLEPPAFRAVFLDVLRLRGLTEEQRGAVVATLKIFLRLHPELARHYEPYILKLIRSRRRADRLFGLPLLAWLDRIRRADLEIVRSCLSGEEEFQMQALNTFCELLKRHRKIAPDVLAYCTSEDVVSTARRLHRRSPYRDVRTCAYYYLKAFRNLPVRRSN